ncbi:MAG: T9SS type A sorting domain-containing protein [Bacteroidia bacterium]
MKKTIITVATFALIGLSNAKAQTEIANSYNAGAGFTSSQGIAYATLSHLSTCQDSVKVNTNASGYNGTWSNSNYNLIVNGTTVGSYSSPQTAINISAYMPITSVEVQGTTFNNWTTANVQVIVYSTASTSPTAPLVQSNVYYYQNSTASALTATLTGTGTSLVWFTDSIGDNYSTTAPTPVTTSTGTVSYWVSEVNASGCESPRSKINVIVSVQGAALNFNGTSNDQINVGTGMNAVLGASGAITVEAWVNPATITSSGYSEIIGNYSAPANQLQFLLRQQQSTYIFAVNIGGSNFTAVTPAGTATVGVWQHVAGVWDGTNVMIYVNGVLQGTTPAVGATLNSTVTNSVVIGYETAGGGEGFSGNMDEVRVWNRALCAGEIMNNMNAEVKLPQTGLLAYYQFNEGMAGGNNSTVTTLADSSGNGYNGTLTAFALTGTSGNWVAPGAVTTGSYSPAFVGPTVSVNSPTILSGATATLTATGTATTFSWSTTATTASITVMPTTTTDYTVTGTDASGCMVMATSTVSVNGAALNFNGTNNTVDLGMGITNALVGGNQITVEAWVAPTNSVSSGGAIVNNHQNTTQFLLGINNSQYYFFIGYGAFSVSTPTAVVTPGSWQHVAGVYDGSSLKIYVNGVLSGTTAVSPTFNFPSSSTTTKLGSDAFGEYFNGSMDEVRIWNRALCGGEIINSMNAELKLPQTSLLAYYKFNEGISGANNSTVTTLADSSGNSDTGTLSNFALTGNTSNWVAPGGVTTGSYSPSFVPPTVTVNSPAICAGSTATLTASGVVTYTWSTSATTASITATPTITANYTVTGADANNCMAWATSTVTVNAVPTVSVNSPTICVGYAANLTSNGASTYSWVPASSSSGLSSTTGSMVTANSATTTTTFTVTGTDVNSCTNTATSTVTVNALPTVSANSNTVSLCMGNTATLTASGTATSYTWSNSATTSTIAITPTVTTTYTVTGTDANGCTNMATVTQTVSTCGTGIEQFSGNNEINIYPNPSNGMFNLIVSQFDNSKTNSVEIYNTLGQLVFSKPILSNAEGINLENLNQGVYTVRVIQNGSYIYHNTIIINK